MSIFMVAIVSRVHNICYELLLVYMYVYIRGRSMKGGVKIQRWISEAGGSGGTATQKL